MRVFPFATHGLASQNVYLLVSFATKVYKYMPINFDKYAKLSVFLSLRNKKKTD
jgi:hypothetical protein